MVLGGTPSTIICGASIIKRGTFEVKRQLLGCFRGKAPAEPALSGWSLFAFREMIFHLQWSLISSIKAGAGWCFLREEQKSQKRGKDSRQDSLIFLVSLSGAALLPVEGRELSSGYPMSTLPISFLGLRILYRRCWFPSERISAIFTGSVRSKKSIFPCKS